MPTVTNKTRKPLKVPLPGGKFLRLGPLKSGQVTPKAVQHPGLAKLVEAGEIEVEGKDARGGLGGGGRGLGGSQNSDRSGGIRHIGDR